MFISIDPGLWGCAVAYWRRDGMLDSAKYYRVTSSNPQKQFETRYWRALAHTLVEPINYGDTVIIELPQVYRYSNTDPNDLIRLATVAGMIGGLSKADVTYILPRQWKRQVKKEVTEARVKTALTPTELGIIELPSQKTLQHNLWDAVGIGLYYLKSNGLR